MDTNRIIEALDEEIGRLQHAKQLLGSTGRPARQASADASTNTKTDTKRSMSPEGRARIAGGTESLLGEAKEEPSGVRVAVVPSHTPTCSPRSVGRLAGPALRLMMQAVAVVSLSPTDSFRTEKAEAHGRRGHDFIPPLRPETLRPKPGAPGRRDPWRISDGAGPVFCVPVSYWCDAVIEGP